MNSYMFIMNSLDAINEMSIMSVPFASKESFPDAEDIDVPENLQRPFRLSFEKVKDEPGKRPIERALEACQVWSQFTQRSYPSYRIAVPKRNANMCCTGTDSTRKLQRMPKPETHGPWANQLHPNLQRHAVLSNFILSKYQLLEDKEYAVCIQRGHKTSYDNKDILQDVLHEYMIYLEYQAELNQVLFIWSESAHLRSESFGLHSAKYGTIS